MAKKGNGSKAQLNGVGGKSRHHRLAYRSASFAHGEGRAQVEGELR